MTVRVGATLSCDGTDCGAHLHEATEAEVRERANRLGWVRVLAGDRDYCGRCAERRAARPKLATLFPGVTLLPVFDAARAAGFTVLAKEGEGNVVCCGAPVTVSSFLGGAHYARCETCGAAIADVTGPQYGNGSMSFMDSDKVDMETEKRWVVVSKSGAAT